MPRRSIWNGSFVDAFLLRMKKKRDLLLNRKIGSHLLLFCRNYWVTSSSILLEFFDCSVRIDNGILFVVRSLKEVINLESFLLHGNKDHRELILDRESKREKSKV